MSSVALKIMEKEQLEDLYDHWFDFDIWPAGKFFLENRTLEDIEQAHEDGVLSAFEVQTEDGAKLFAILINDDHPHVDLHSASGEEVTIEQGRSTLDALLTWANDNTEIKKLHKYLDAEPAPIHAQFAAWGFEQIDDEEAEDAGWQIFSIDRSLFSNSLS